MIARRRGATRRRRAGVLRLVGLAALITASGLASAPRTHEAAFVTSAAPTRCTPAI